MKILLDTHILLWSLAGSDQLRAEWKDLITDNHNSVLVSVISLWECIIKAGIGKLSLSAPYYDTLMKGISETGFELLDLKPTHIQSLENLENYHKDPFDRILICQARSENLTLLTDDSQILRYKLP